MHLQVNAYASQFYAYTSQYVCVCASVCIFFCKHLMLKMLNIYKSGQNPIMEPHVPIFLLQVVSTQ